MMNAKSKMPIPVNVVGSSTFGRYPKVSAEKTYNMFISDGWLMNYAGFAKKFDISQEGFGRGAFHSERGNFVVVVIGSQVVRVTDSFGVEFVGEIETVVGEVYMDENLARQIAIVDGRNLYIFNYETGEFVKQVLTFIGNEIIPGYVVFHNTFFLIAPNPASENPQNWYVYEFETSSTIQLNIQLTLQTKPDSAIAIQRIPGKGNNILVLGKTVSEVWTQVGGAQNYRRVSSYNIDYGVAAISTVASAENLVCWLATNEDSDVAIMWSDGSRTQRISTDGIDNLLQNIERPDLSTALFFRQDGHLFYQLTFFGNEDNVTLLYDFNTKSFFFLTDEKLDYHPARKIINFQGKNYFVSLNDGGFYENSSNFVSYKYSTDPNALGETIPRIRICKAIRQKNGERFRAANFHLWLEQGVNDFFAQHEDSVQICKNVLISEDGTKILVSEDGDKILLGEMGSCQTNLLRPRVDMSISKTGGETFSNVVSRPINPSGKYRNHMNWYRLGQANEFIVQLRFWGFQRFVAAHGTLEIY